MIIEDGILKLYDGNMKNVVIPDGVKTIAGDRTREDMQKTIYPGDSIFYNAFAGNSEIETVTMPDSVVTVGPKAFEHCKNLSSVKFSNKLKTISMSSFLGCVKLTKITIPSSVKEIDQWSLDLIDFEEIEYAGTIAEFGKINISSEGFEKKFPVKCTDGITYTKC